MKLASRLAQPLLSPPVPPGGEGTVVGAQWLACGEGSPVFLFSQLSQPLGFPSDHVADDCFISHPPTHPQGP